MINWTLFFRGWVIDEFLLIQVTVLYFSRMAIIFSHLQFFFSQKISQCCNAQNLNQFFIFRSKVIIPTRRWVYFCIRTMFCSVWMSKPRNKISSILIHVQKVSLKIFLYLKQYENAYRYPIFDSCVIYLSKRKE